jgi:hypothetical protein
MLRSQFLYFSKYRGHFVGLVLSGLVRTALLIRAGKAFVAGHASDDKSERATARMLIDLVKYDPRRLLPHEVAAAHS